MDLKELIKSCYPKDIDNIEDYMPKYKTTVVYAERIKAKKWFDNYYKNNSDNIKEYRNGIHNLSILLNNNDRIVHAVLSDNSKGYRYQSVVLDYKNMTYNVFRSVILCMAVFCTQDNVHFIE